MARRRETWRDLWQWEIQPYQQLFGGMSQAWRKFFPQHEQTPGSPVSRPAAETRSAGAQGPIPGEAGVGSIPFDRNYFRVSGLKFGDAYPLDPSGFHPGVDYGLPEGQALYAPFRGKVTDVSDRYWGTAIRIQFDDGSGGGSYDGSTYTVGHLRDARVRSGQLINAGTLIGYSGATGHSSEMLGLGPMQPHLYAEMRDPKGNPVDVHQVFQKLFADPAAAAHAMSETGLLGLAPSSAHTRRTPDGHILQQGSEDGRYYSMAESIWKQTYGPGAEPPWSVAEALRNSGVKNEAQVRAIINGMPSHIPGWDMGHYTTMKNAVDQAAEQLLGRPVPDSLMKQLAAQGIDDPEAAVGWLLNHPASSIPKEDYQRIFDLAGQISYATGYGHPGPDQVHDAYKAAGGTFEPPRERRERQKEEREEHRQPALVEFPGRGRRAGGMLE